MASGNENRKRSEKLQVRLSPDEIAALLAKAGDMSPADYIRTKLLDLEPTKSRRRRSVDAEALVRLRGELGKVGSNLNQIAKAANASGRVREGILADALAHFAELRAQVLQAIKVA